ncbi:hypothetical protein KYC5002_39010 [Archangium violaceum]|uniref:hypothetical protein n=1 Tax=Archangium violaceum TaxID=83451 RepID=UPI002B27E951|nr:hypothetical protein KYC5002_39010 [Archangium gephyra]
MKANVNQSLTFYIIDEPGNPPGPAGYMLTLRKSVAQFSQTGSDEEDAKKADVVLRMTRGVFDDMIRTEGDGKSDLKTIVGELIRSKQINTLKGNAVQTTKFCAQFGCPCTFKAKGP